MTVFADEFENAQIYVGTYKKYSHGSIEGEWVRLFDYDNKEDFMNRCREIHSDEHPDELELMFQDCEGLLECMCSEIDIDKDLWKLMEWVNIEDLDLQAVLDYIDGSNNFDFNDLARNFSDYYQGQYKDMIDYAMSIVDMSGVPKWLENYIDWESYAQDLEFDGYWISDNSYVFRDW